MATNKLKIFVVDDNNTNLEKCFRYLVLSGYNDVHTFNNGALCTGKLKDQPDVIFLAYGQSNPTGLKALHQINNINHGAQVVLLPTTEYRGIFQMGSSSKNKEASMLPNQSVTQYIDHILSRLSHQTNNAA